MNQIIGSNGTTAQENVTVKAGTTGDLNFVANWESEGIQIQGKLLSEQSYGVTTYQLYDTNNDNVADTALFQDQKLNLGAATNTAGQIGAWKNGSTIENIVFDNCDIQSISFAFDQINQLKTVTVNNCYKSNSDTGPILRFCNDINLQKIIFSNMDSIATTMCFGNSSLQNVEYKNIGTLYDLSFKDASSLTYIDFSQCKRIAPSKLTQAFQGCTSLKTLDLSKFDLSRLNNSLALNNVFYNCTVLEELNLSGLEINYKFDVNDFSSLSSIKTIYCPAEWNCDKVDLPYTMKYYDGTKYINVTKMDSSICNQILIK